MLLSTGGEGTRYNKTKTINRLSSSSSSTSSSPSPFSPSHLHQTPRKKTMEEVWKDINLASLQDHPSRDQVLPDTPPLNNNHHNTTNFRSMMFGDFLARPFSKVPAASIVSSAGDSPLYGSPVPPPATVLSLNSGPEFHFLDNSDPPRPNSHLQSHPISNVSSFNGPYEPLVSSSGLPSFGKKRLQEFESSTGDRRHKRMIKNRESAARSRARKQAYTNELELEVTHLMEENARLRRQQEQICVAAADQLPKKHTLHRASTAPF